MPARPGSERVHDFAVGSVAAREEATLSLGPHHPSMHGLMRLRVVADHGIVTSADPGIGYVHRGAEKLFEARDYRQLLTLANRHDWTSAFAGELGVALAVERLLGLSVPERAVWARTLMAELTRVFSHLVFLSAFPWPTPRDAGQVRQWGGRERELVQQALERYTGGRLHVAATRIGGLHADMDQAWLRDLDVVLVAVRSLLPRLRHELVDGEGSIDAGIATLDAQTAASFGASGHVGRASGLDLDLRRDQPELAYDELFGAGGPGHVVTAQAGDVRARVTCLLDQLAVSLDLVMSARDRLLSTPPGPVGVRLPKTLRVPEGESYVWMETPLGIAGYLLVSRGGRSPWRLKLRTPSFAHLSLLPTILPGTRLEHLPAALASLSYVLGDADR